MQPLRWILLLVGVVFLAALAWWESRRPRQASDDARLRAEHREPTLNDAGLAGIDAGRTPQPPLPVITLGADTEEGVLGPARTLDAAVETVGAATTVEPMSAAVDAAGAGTHSGDDIPTLTRSLEAALAAAPPLLVEWPAEGERRILSLRLVPPPDQRYSGRSLRQALAALGFVHGRFAIFHQPDRTGRAVLSVASLVRPGILDPDSMDFQRFPGVSIFAVLPGPLSDVDALEHLLAVTHDLLDRLGGRLQDDRGGPLDAVRIARWRSELSGTAAPAEEPPGANGYEPLSGQPAEPAA